MPGPKPVQGSCWIILSALSQVSNRYLSKAGLSQLKAESRAKIMLGKKANAAVAPPTSTNSQRRSTIRPKATIMSPAPIQPAREAVSTSARATVSSPPA
ncbi:hypothetical protein D3C72_1705240 [compost metagenome]